MNILKILGVAVVLIIVSILAMSPEKILRYAKSAVLIASTQKFERVLVDAPSILVTGDSTGYGTGASSSLESIAGRIASEYPRYSIFNSSKNGRTLEGLLEELQEIETTRKYDLILLQIGGNDVLQKTPLDLVESRLEQVLRESKKYSDNILVMSSGNVGGASAFGPYGSEESLAYEAQTRKVRDIFITVADREGVVYVDLFAEPEKDVFIKEPEKYLAYDGLHPSSLGYGLWYVDLKPALVSILKP